MTQEALKELLRSMSLQEKADQLMQLRGAFYNGNSDEILTGPAAQLGISEENIKMAGSILGTAGAEAVIDIQKRYVENHPHHIPLLFMMDVIHGMRTIFPAPIGLGASFEPELSERCAAVAAIEAAVSGLHVAFSPMVDLVRDARWGRVMESTGEDPYLNGKFAAAQVKGFQGEDMGEPYRVCACIKHFAGYGGAVAGREYNTVDVSEHTFRDFYLPAYKEGIDAGVGMVMSAFNTVNGIPASANEWLMRDVLRKEMGFEGVLISDFAAIEETIAHGCLADEKQAAEKALKAGMDIDMMTGVYSSNLKQLVEEGVLDEELIDEAVLRVLQLKNKLGLFENPFKDADPVKEKEICLCKEHRELAREAAVKSFVLLKNDGLLPLDRLKKIAFIGPYTDNKEMNSSWAVTGNTEDCITIKEAAETVFDSKKTSYYQGCSVLGFEGEVTGFSGATVKISAGKDLEKSQEEMLAAAKEADIVVMPLGEHYMQSGEAHSRGEITIPEVQMELFRKVASVNENIVVLLFNGRPLDIREITRYSKAILECWMPGTEGGNAIVDVLTGKENPSGKLSMSFPYSVGQCPVYYNEYSTGRPYEGKDVRYCSRYIDIPNKPLFPFGYGLSYSSFEISDIMLDKDRLTGVERVSGDSIIASVTVKNTGEMAGTEVLQLYIQDVSASVVRPVKELKGFSKVNLNKGEEREIHFEITEDMLAFTKADGSFGAEKGLFRVWIGNSSETENVAMFELV